MSAATSVAYYVEDACGDKFLYTIADADYEPAFRKHAAWWLGYMQRSRKDFRGNRLMSPAKPCRVVVSPCT